MACIPEIDPKPEITENDITFRGRCVGQCETGCKAKFVMSQDGKINKGAKVTGSGYGSTDAFIRITAEDDIDDGVVVLKCNCGREVTEEEYHFTLVHRTTVQDVLEIIFTAGLKLLFTRIP